MSAERVQDKDGDTWERRADGLYELISSSESPGAVGTVHSLDSVEDAYGPLESVGDAANFRQFVAELSALVDSWAKRLGV